MTADAFWDAATALTLIAMAVLYVRGLAVLWRSGAGHQTVRRWQAAAFAAGWLSVVAALLSPIDTWSDILFSAHMTQHEILMLVTAPLMVIGRPFVVMLWALSATRRAQIGRGIRRPALLSMWSAVTGPFAVLVLHAVVLWIWHIPALFEAALANETIHVFQHLTFFATAALFWWALIHGRYGRVGYGVGVIYVFATAMHTQILGALLTFGRHAWYPTHAARTGAQALEDQQLAGVVMWVPFGAVFVLIALALFAAWLGELERRAAFTTADRLTRTRQGGTIVAILLLLQSCRPETDYSAVQLTAGGDPMRGKAAIGRYGCGACHEIPGVDAANGLVGPSLAKIADRTFLAGQLPNQPDNMMMWIVDPQRVESGTAMPDLNVTEGDARDIAAYLYTLRADR